MNGKNLNNSGWLLLLYFYLLSPHVQAEVGIVYQTSSEPVRFAVSKLIQALEKTGEEALTTDLLFNQNDRRKKIFIILENSTFAKRLIPAEVAKYFQQIHPEGFALQIHKNSPNLDIFILAKDNQGALYGTLELAEQVRISGNLNLIKPTVSNPRFEFRGIKFNLPWSPYRNGPATEIHLDICRDINFWQKFLDTMAENRFNVLSLWNLHPFPFMIRPQNFPQACFFSEEEMADWKNFWTTLFRMAKNRGIDTYLVNWNIVVSPEFAKVYQVKEKNDTSAVVRRYTQECVTQVINEYPDLTGLGVTLADWMNQMTPKEREDWIEQTFITGIKKANRPVKFIHRSVLAGSPLEMRRVIDNADLPDPVWVEIKFNWSHGFSTPLLATTHDYPTGEIDRRFWDPPAKNIKIVWMIRNEDFFILRWGQPDFIRQHIKKNSSNYVGGYFIGSEGYIPALDFSHTNLSHQTWQYGFEKQWLFYKLWGRLLYDPETPNAIFEKEFIERYPSVSGSELLKAYTIASRMPLRLASFHAGTWDYTLYSEGFLAPRKSRGYFDEISAFISIDEFINHQTLDSTLLSIPDFVQKILNEKNIDKKHISPLQLAAESNQDGMETLTIIRNLEKNSGTFPGALECELLDLKTWAYLSLYFAEKLYAGIALETFRHTGNLGQQLKAIRHLEFAAGHWERIIENTEIHYQAFPHVSGEIFSWKNYWKQVLRDIEIAKNSVIRLR
jgi:hypothetical protein